MSRKTKKFKWVVEIVVDEVWVEDGFNLTPERLRAMVSADLQFAYEGEIGVKIIESPNPDSILDTQGYDAGKLTKKEKLSLLR